jgi:FixJ family two-component response regulator
MSTRTQDDACIQAWIAGPLSDETGARAMRSAEATKPIVIVEDDASMSQALERILRLGGHVSISYPSAEALLANSNIADVSCLIVDVQLPGITGFELHSRLTQRGPTPPVIFITAYDEPEARARAKSAGAAAFFAKPFSGRVLLETVREAVTVP